jgi:hypothetical protein
MDNFFDVVGRWGPRQEDSESLARRLARYLADLAAIDPLFRCWARGGFRHRSIVPSQVTLPPSLPELRAWLDENPLFDARDGRKAWVGHSIAADTPANERPHAPLWLVSQLGDRPGILRGRIGLTVSTPASDPWSLRRTARPLLLALAESWEVGWAGVATGDYSERGHRPEGPTLAYKSGWMVYLDAEHAGRITAPEDVRVEPQPNGGVLLTATEEFFSNDNVAHRAAARRIQTALAPLNAEPSGVLS